jgi:release factor glutamine methyltransferase
MTALEVDRAELYARFAESPSPTESETAESLIGRRLRHEPAAYLMGRREFYGLDVTVAPGVLIPRPDTETLVEEALAIALSLGETHPAIADVGCGSGAIAVALAVNLPRAALFAIDTAQRALEITRLNAERHGVADRIEVLEGDLLAPLRGPVDLIAANLPYVMSSEIPTLEPEVRSYEPREALDGGDDGLDVIRRLLDAAPSSLRSGGAVLLEIDPRQVASATAYAGRALPGAAVRLVKDLTGRDRVLVVQT